MPALGVTTDVLSWALWRDMKISTRVTYLSVAPIAQRDSIPSRTWRLMKGLILVRNHSSAPSVTRNSRTRAIWRGTWESTLERNPSSVPNVSRGSVGVTKWESMKGIAEGVMEGQKSVIMLHLLSEKTCLCQPTWPGFNTCQQWLIIMLLMCPPLTIALCHQTHPRVKQLCFLTLKYELPPPLIQSFQPPTSLLLYPFFRGNVVSQTNRESKFNNLPTISKN